MFLLHVCLGLWYYFWVIVPSLVEVEKEEKLISEAGKLMRGREGSRGGKKGGTGAQIWNQRVDSLLETREDSWPNSIALTPNAAQRKPADAACEWAQEILTLYINTVPCRWLTDFSCPTVESEQTKEGEEVWFVLIFNVQILAKENISEVLLFSCHTNLVVNVELRGHRQKAKGVHSWDEEAGIINPKVNNSKTQSQMYLYRTFKTPTLDQGSVNVR